MSVVGADSKNRGSHVPTTGVATFVLKLWAILGDPEALPHIRWEDPSRTNCDKIVVVDTMGLAVRVLPRYFKHSNAESFVRQLNIYGFYKVTADQRRAAATDAAQPTPAAPSTVAAAFSSSSSAKTAPLATAGVSAANSESSKLSDVDISSLSPAARARRYDGCVFRHNGGKFVRNEPRNLVEVSRRKAPARVRSTGNANSLDLSDSSSPPENQPSDQAQIFPLTAQNEELAAIQAVSVVTTAATFAAGPKKGRRATTELPQQPSAKRYKSSHEKGGRDRSSSMSSPGSSSSESEDPSPSAFDTSILSSLPAEHQVIFLAMQEQMRVQQEQIRILTQKLRKHERAEATQLSVLQTMLPELMASRTFTMDHRRRIEGAEDSSDILDFSSSDLERGDSHDQISIPVRALQQMGLGELTVTDQHGEISDFDSLIQGWYQNDPLVSHEDRVSMLSHMSEALSPLAQGFASMAGDADDDPPFDNGFL